MQNSGTTSTVSEAEQLAFTSDIVSSFVSHNPIPSSALPDLIKSVHDTLRQISSAIEPEPARPDPAVPVSKSVTDDFIICLEDGRKLKMMKRYLRTQYGLSPDSYRERWNLPSDYPMVAPNYAKKRSQFAKKIGLGRKRAS